MAPVSTERPRRWARAAQGALAVGRVAGRVLVALARLAWGLADVARHVIVCCIAAAFGWRFGAR